MEKTEMPKACTGPSHAPWTCVCGRVGMTGDICLCGRWRPLQVAQHKTEGER